METMYYAFRPFPRRQT